MRTSLKRMKELAEFVCAVWYALFIGFFQKKPCRLVLYYHGVSTRDTERFETQMAYLSKRCTVVKPSQIMSSPPEGTKTVVAITFDDAFLSVAKNATPILKKYRLPAGIFVVAGNLGKRPRWKIRHSCPDKYEIVMNKEQIAELHRAGFEIGSHTFSHRLLMQLEVSELEAELVNSKCVLETITGQQILTISYPHGAYDQRICEVAERAGYEMGFTVEPRRVDDKTDCMMIGRFRASPKESIAEFKLKVRGAYQARLYLQSAKRLLHQGFS